MNISRISTILLAGVVKQFKYTIMEDSVREQMNHKNTTLAIAAILAAVAMTAVAFAIPQQALAYGHHHNNSIKVSQDISQLNACSNSTCVNSGSNSVDIDR